MTLKVLAAITIAALVVIAMVSEILVVEHRDQRRTVEIAQQDQRRAVEVARKAAYETCVSSNAVRAPFANYVDSEVRLIRAAHADGVSLAPRRFSKLDRESFRNLVVLHRALDRAVQQSCKR